jgi:hypothetical protein
LPKLVSLAEAGPKEQDGSYRIENKGRPKAFVWNNPIVAVAAVVKPYTDASSRPSA